MQLVKAWVFPADSAISPESIIDAIDRSPAALGSVEHLYLTEQDGWWNIGIYLSGNLADESGRGVTLVRTALLEILSGVASTVVVEAGLPEIPPEGSGHTW